MIRNLKALGLALVAVFAMSAFAASAAQATEATFSWDAGTKHLLATADPTAPSHEFSITGGAIGFTCDTVTGTGDLPEGVTDSESITATNITYTQSGQAEHTCKGPLGTKPSVKMNGCHYTFHAGTTIKSAPEGHSTGTVDIECPTGGSIEINGAGCLVKVGQQTGVGDITYKTVKTSTKEEVTIEAKVHNPMEHATNTISYSHSGFTCGTGSGSNGTYTGKVTVKGFDAENKQTNVTIT